MSSPDIYTSSTRATFVWVLLVVLTLATYAVGKAGLEGLNIAALILLSVFIKGHFLIADFMGLRDVKKHWRFLVHGWLIFVAGMIGLAYKMGVSGL